MIAEILSKEMQKRPPTELVTVCRWQRSAAAEGRWGSLTKCGVTVSLTVPRFYDGPSCRYVIKFKDVVSVPIFQEFKCFGTRPSTGRCACDDPSYSLSRVMKRAAEETTQVWDDGVHNGPRDHDDPSRGPSTQMRFDRFPVNRVLV